MPDAPDSKAEWIARVLGFDVAPSGMPGDSALENGLPGSKAMVAWKAARAAALGSLKALESAIRDMDDPDGNEAIILLRAIQANLTAEPATSRQMDELERYLTTDDIIEEAEEPNAFGFEVSLRAPLMAALADLRSEQSKTGGGGQ